MTEADAVASPQQIIQRLIDNSQATIGILERSRSVRPADAERIIHRLTLQQHGMEAALAAIAEGNAK